MFKEEPKFYSVGAVVERRVEELKDTIVLLLEDNCERGLLTMKSHLLHHLWDDLEKLSTIQFLVPYNF